MPTVTLERPTIALPMPRGNGPVEPVTVQDGSITFHPAEMETGRYYWVELNGKPYGYRKISNTEIEVYGLAE